MNLFDEYVESLLHFNLNFYLAFSPERGRTVGELVTIISSALARSGVSCTAAGVNQSIEKRIAINDGFVQASHDKIWLNFVSSLASAQPIPPALPTAPTQPSPVPMVEMAAAPAAADQSVADVAPEVTLETAPPIWKQRIWDSAFKHVAATVHDVNSENFPIRLLADAYSKLRDVATEQIKEEYLEKLLKVLNLLDSGNGLNRLNRKLVGKLRDYGDTGPESVRAESSTIVAHMRPWISKSTASSS